MAAGPDYVHDGETPETGRQGRTGEAIVAQAHGKYYESASRGSTAFASDAAGVATVTSIGTVAILALYNPAGSGYKLVVQKVTACYFSGTLGGGAVFHCVNPVISGIANPTAPSGGTLLTSRFSRIMSQENKTPVGIVRTGATVVAPVVFRPFFSAGAGLATTPAFLNTAMDDLDGEIVLEPGGVYQLQSVCASGSTPLITVGLSWEEIPHPY